NGTGNDQEGFNDELDLQLRFVAAQNFSDPDFPGTVDRLCGGEVDKIHARRQQNKRGDQPQYTDQFTTDGHIAVVACLRVIMYFRQCLQYVTVLMIGSLYLPRVFKQLTVEVRGGDIRRQ